MRALLVSLSLSAVLVLATACGPGSNSCEQCGDVCADLESDPANCGECGVACPGAQVCISGSCMNDPGEMCDPGASEACYDGPASTNGVAGCHGGTRNCLDNGYWGACAGQVTPGQDVCGNGADEDCDGTADNPTDEDDDGFTNCTGDCCDSTDEGCQQPELVNPGAFEVAGNMLDDDCDGNVDNEVTAACDSGLMSNSNAALDYAKAIDLCQTATETDGRWGVISAQFLRADGTGVPVAAQRAIRPAFGSTTVQHGMSMAVISTAHAAATGQLMPAFSSWQSTQHNTTSGFPSDWYMENGNALPNAPDCPPPIGTVANDPVMLELRVRTPSNAKSFSLKTNFMSAEFPEYTCTPFNDFFVVLLDSAWSGSPANPADKNLAFYVSPTNQIYPVGVNLAFGDTGLFTVCQNGATGCAGIDPADEGQINTCSSNSELVGTGMDPSAGGAINCSGSDQIGGGTGWLTTSGNVNGSEIIKLRIALWDTSDARYDSVALIDNFVWSIDPSDPGTVIDVD